MLKVAVKHSLKPTERRARSNTPTKRRARVRRTSLMSMRDLFFISRFVFLLNLFQRAPNPHTHSYSARPFFRFPSSSSSEPRFFWPPSAAAPSSSPAEGGYRGKGKERQSISFFGATSRTRCTVLY